LLADEEMRRKDSKAVLESDDVIAAYQPAVWRWVLARVEATVLGCSGEVDMDEIDAVVRVVSVLLLVLSYAVVSPNAELCDSKRVS
jgi:hypothetical protein